ncbi:feline leukemia virus subgroup C receptor-related protein 2 isoform X2 [Octopus sinensis]|uniref:Choline/ethanolamine transporter FLVCR1 n=1 Tax=Octopus sinensis TaxID=2607531 RepID=A0A6P7S4S2_9MOLL|nr:feline leukemia virus subgroup C receptor-related protein 2 isoform X2 [Octopus sinensis]
MGKTSTKPAVAANQEGDEAKLNPDSDTNKNETSQLDDSKVHPLNVFKRRWIVLTLFCFFSMSNAYQWIHLNIVANIIETYYNASLPTDEYQRELAVDWLSMVYMLAYIPLIFPASWLLDRKGLRVIIICGTLLNCVGAWLKCISASPDRFWLLMIAQTICGIAQIFVLEVPPRLAAVWFGPNEVSTATSIGVFGNQVGVAIGFLVPPVIITESGVVEEIGQDLSHMFYGTAGVTTALFLLCLVGFQKQPPEPPSRAQMLALQAGLGTDNYLVTLFRLLKNWSYTLLMVTYGMNTGSYYAISTLLNTVVLKYFPGYQKEVGEIGLTIIISGVGGSIVAGLWLDKTKTFKSTTLMMYLLSLGGMIAFTFTLDLNKIWVIFISAGVLGFFMTGYLPVGFEFAVEITFPEPEGTSSGLMNASAQVFGILFTIGMRTVVNQASVFAANLSICIALLIGLILTCFVRANYRRQKAEMQIMVHETNVVIEEPEVAGENSVLIRNSSVF